MRRRLFGGLLLAALCLAGPARSEARSLADDGRAGVVADLQGTALVQPAGRSRWSPSRPRTVLLPGDRVRTMTRGAHAAEIRLAGGGTLVLGPGARAALEAPGKIRLFAGDAEIAGTSERTVTVSGPGGFVKEVRDAAVLRASETGTVELERPPRWLEGYRASTTDEWMGSLVAKVDGRDVPLTVGYHKVSVVIRDQIAETTVEQSFVNRTTGRLEGVFSFPLPADASVSGFGMWISGELVEADIVERQRARQIYEDIRRRQKDPGLLEWSGGNLFKASVFPILPHSEKRVRLRYTQVLPLEGTKLRYRYALRSELLRTNPVRDLQVKIRVASAAALEGASSPTHEVTVQRSDHAATVEFTAREYRPQRDFEAVFDLAPSAAVTVAPHRRGEDGYFMLLLSSPDAGAAGWQRDLMPEGDPLDVVFVADTSGSMGPDARRAQADFLEAALALLGPQDRFQLVAHDVGAAWFRPERAAADPQTAAAAVEFLARRRSLGWTDLDAALDALEGRVGPGTVVVYMGDGIGTTGDADPVALAQRIERYGRASPAQFHAVSPGPSYEAGVLGALASIGGGSVRAADADAAGAAYGLFSEIARPTVRDLRVSFEGLRTARVYPERLPPLPAGRQQTVLGRFLPSGAEASSGRVVVTGTLAGEPVRYTAELTLTEGEEGNSFVPRLWARRHLDALLAEGRTPANQADIVAFSEEYGIITPYTSFLVLESDADRERYGVARRVRMRDGERFFADGKSAADLEALRAEIQQSRRWRMQLLRRMRRDIARLGRDLYGTQVAYSNSAPGGGGSGPYGPASGSAYRGGWGETPPDSREPSDPGFDDQSESDSFFDDDARFAREEADLDDWEGEEELARAPSMAPPAAEPAMAKSAPRPGGDFGRPGSREVVAQGRQAGLPGPFEGGARDGAGLRSALGAKQLEQGYARYSISLLGRFPPISGVLPAPPAPAAAEWEPAAASLLDAVSQAPTIDAPDGGVEVVFEGSRPAAAGWSAKSRARTLVAADRWACRTRQDLSESTDRWVAGGTRGILLVGQRLGRRRPSAERDVGDWARFSGVGVTDWRLSHAKWKATVESREGDLAIVRLDAPAPQTTVMRLTIDVAKGLVVRTRTFQGDTLQFEHRAEDIVQIAGRWWPRRTRSVDADGKETWSTTLAVRLLDGETFGAEFAAALAGQDDVVFLDAADPSLADAKQAAHEKRAELADLLRIAEDHAAFGRADEALTAFAQARAGMPGKPGADWLEMALLVVSRRGEHFLALLEGMAASLGERSDLEAGPLARLLHQHAGSLGRREHLDLVDDLERAGAGAAEPPEEQQRVLWWRRVRATQLRALGRTDEALAIWRAIQAEYPREFQACQELLNALVSSGDLDGAVAFSATVDPPTYGWQPYQSQSFYQQYARSLWNAYRFDDLLDATEGWVAAAPQDTQAYAARLSTWFASGDIAAHDAWLAARFDEELPKPDDHVGVARLTAAVGAALGGGWYGWNRWNQRFDSKWTDELERVAIRVLRDDELDLTPARMVIQHHWFAGTDAVRRVRAAAVAHLAVDGVVARLAVARLVQLTGWLPWDPDSVDDATWRRVVDGAVARWRAEDEQNLRTQLAYVVLRLLDARGAEQEVLDLLRERHGAARQADRPADVAWAATELVNRLVRGDWTREREDEILALVPDVAEPGWPEAERRVKYAHVVRNLTDRLLVMRFLAERGPAEEVEQLPRAERRVRETEARTKARRDLMARLAAEAKAASDDLRPCYEIERLCYAVETGEDLPGVEGEAREILLGTSGDATDWLAWIQRQRASLVLSHAAIQSKAPEGLSDRVLALYREQMAKESKDVDWRLELFRLLVALDRPEELERQLREWLVPADVDSTLRIALGYVLAESGKLAEAAEQFEEAARLDELDERGHVVLARWYLVLGDDARREATLDRSYRMVVEWQLRNRIWQMQPRLSRDEAPQDLDEEVLRVIRALLRKAASPGNYVGDVDRLYRQTKDFRLLASLADGALGHTPQATYGFLTQCWSVLSNVHEEATCDEIRARIEERMADVKTDTDRRALRLLLCQVERRAGDVLNQPGPHAKRALAFLRLAREGGWLEGERRHMAEFLAALGTIPHPELATEQLAQLRDLHALERPGTVDRLRIAYALHRTEWGYQRSDAATDGLTAALAEHRQASGGALPASAFDVLGVLSSWHVSRKQFGAAERLLLDEQRRQPSKQGREWCGVQVFGVYRDCLRSGGTVSHGSGEKVYRAARAQTETALREYAASQMAGLVEIYCDLHRAAKDVAKVRSAGADLVAFSRDALPAVLLRGDSNHANNVINRVGGTVEAVAGGLAALTFYVERLEAEPVWFRRQGQSCWRSVGGRAATLRRKVEAPAELEDRLLAVALVHLEAELLSTQRSSREMFHVGNHGFWKEKADRFAAVARRVIEQNPDESAVLSHTAQFLWADLHLYDEAIRTLEDASRRDALDENGRAILVNWYRGRKAWEPMLPHLARLIGDNPLNVRYRTLRIEALHGSGRDDEARATADEALAFFRERPEYRDQMADVLHQLAGAALAATFHARAAAWWDEAIPLRQRTLQRARSGLGDGTLQAMYTGLAQARVALGESDAAVDAALAAIVIWGPAHRSRTSATRGLDDVLSKIPDLDAWAATWEARVAETGEDAALVRMALGRAYVGAKRPGAAVPHLHVARRLSPEDPQAHELLVAALEAAGDTADAAAALADFVHHHPRNLDLHGRLAERLREVQRPEDAERALTGLVEFAPNEAEGHRRLASIREEQKRFDDAVVQWRQVVRVRTLEPQGWLGLATAQVAAGSPDDARSTLTEMLRRSWEPRFSGEVQRARKLLEGLGR